MRIHLCLTSILLSLCACLFAQESDSTINRLANFPDRLFNKIKNKANHLENGLTGKTEKYLQRLASRETKLKKELYKQDSIGSKYLFINNPQLQYASFVQNLKTDSSKPNKTISTEYLPYEDSLQSAVSFLNKNPQLLPKASKIIPTDIQNSMNQLKELQAKMQDAELIRQFILERRDQFKQYILQHTQLPGSITSIYYDYNKQLYYYSQQLHAYKEILNDPDKMLKTALKLLNKLPAFSAFMQKNSFLAGLFNMPDDYSMASAMPGMQTREMINQLIQGQISAGGPNAAAALSQSLQSAQGQLEQLKDKIKSLGASGESADLPSNFKPNNQKSKTVLQRLEFGTNLQTTRSSYFYPNTSDIGLSVGYKLDNKTTLGLGISYKIGFGKDIRHVHVTSEGIGLRSFVDIQMKKSFFASGGLEYNYQQPFASFQQIRAIHEWQSSGLIGLSKVVSINTKFFKKTKIQLLWDFLSYQQLPRSQPFKFRVGYNL